MLRWKVRRSWDEEPDVRTRANAYARSFAAVKVDGSDEAHTTIEFDGRSSGANALAAQYVLMQFLESDERPPRRVLVGAGGAVQSVER